MSDRAATLAAAFERANDDLIAALEGCSADRARRVCEEEGWAVTVAAHHVAVNHPRIVQLVQLIANGQPVPPITREMIDAGNAQHAQECANVSREETLELLRREGKAAADGVRALSDEQLDRTAPIAFAGGAPWRAADVIERVLIGHPTTHGQSIRAAVAG
jgi:hypothetical protein